MRSRHRGALRRDLWVAPLVLLAACGDPPPAGDPPAPRSVIAEAQRISDPARRLRVAGAVGPWKQEELSFEVSGRVTAVVDTETEVSGPNVDEGFRGLGDGDVVARIDPERYQSALDATKARRQSVEAQRAVARRQLEDVLPQELARATSERKRAEENLGRIERASERRAVSERELTDARAAFQSAVAMAEQAQGRVRAAESELLSLEAQVAEVEQAVLRAELDLRDTVLRAPFSGRITDVSVVPGALVTPATVVARLVMMNPMRVDLQVSAEMARRVSDKDIVEIHPHGRGFSMPAAIYQRSSMVDVNTRTVEISLLCRNTVAGEMQDAASPISDVKPLIQLETPDGPRWFLEIRGIYGDAEGDYHAWKLLDIGDRKNLGARSFEVVRLPLRLGQHRKDFAGIYRMREVLAEGEVAEIVADAPGVTANTCILAMGLPEGFEGGRVQLQPNRWLLQPGELVDVDLGVVAGAPGVYVPASALMKTREGTAVFVAVPDGEGARLRSVPVEVTGRVGTLVRIGDVPVGDGHPVIREGNHVLREGMAVRVALRQTER